MKILSVESSAASCSVALSDNGVLIGEEFTNVKLTHSETLMPMVKNILDNTKTDIGAVLPRAQTCRGSLHGLVPPFLPERSAAGARERIYDEGADAPSKQCHLAIIC